ncbi:MAG: peptidylprolyl isomerase [Bacteroidales bacterium]|nr:peptidylprolyl isomerase [Bacteroidales bacterium]
MNTIKKISLSVLFVLAVNAVDAQQDKTVVDGVIAVVGENMIKYSELETNYLQMLSSGDNTVTRCEVLESMLLNKLMLHQAKVDSLTVSDAEVENELNSRVAYMMQYYGSQEKMERQMNKSLAQIKETYRDIIKENILIQQKQSQITGDVTVTPQEVADFYATIPEDSLAMIPTQYVFSQIVITPTVSEQEKQELKNKLNEYRDRILKGTKFSVIASMYSDDQASAKKGGELGFFQRGTMVAEFENVAFSLQPGEVSPVFETKYGYHIIQMIERRGDRVNCRHILLQPKVSSLQLYKAKEKIDSIKTLIDNNELTFEDAIVRYSEDESKVNGGLIINPNTASSVFSSEALNASMGNVDNVDFAAMKQGDITSAVEFKSEYADAYRLIKVLKIMPEHKVNLTDDFDKIHALALNKKRMDIVHSWAKNTIKKTYIRVDDGYKTCGFTLDWYKTK